MSSTQYFEKDWDPSKRKDGIVLEVPVDPSKMVAGSNAHGTYQKPVTIQIGRYPLNTRSKNPSTDDSHGGNGTVNNGGPATKSGGKDLLHDKPEPDPDQLSNNTNKNDKNPGPATTNNGPGNARDEMVFGAGGQATTIERGSQAHYVLIPQSRSNIVATGTKRKQGNAANAANKVSKNNTNSNPMALR
ncbi:hypothetical protein V5O48_016799 [Marasmius crinis-equi]|uniref:Uncharacterized protein n=1 Tax=Marasmius crinis-equi TaxID=585013 RepID=A0ABR3EQZ7_9AGAR